MSETADFKRFTILLEGRHDFEQVSEKIYKECDDALVSECRGVVTIDVIRENDSFENAILSALVQLFRIGLNVARVEIGSSSSPIVTRSGLPRQIDTSP